MSDFLGKVRKPIHIDKLREEIEKDYSSIIDREQELSDQFQDWDNEWENNGEYDDGSTKWDLQLKYFSEDDWLDLGKLDVYRLYVEKMRKWWLILNGLKEVN